MIADTNRKKAKVGSRCSMRLNREGLQMVRMIDHPGPSSRPPGLLSTEPPQAIRYLLLQDERSRPTGTEFILAALPSQRPIARLCLQPGTGGPLMSFGLRPLIVDGGIFLSRLSDLQLRLPITGTESFGSSSALSY